MSRHPVTTGAAMHLAGYRALGLDFTYIPFAVTDVEGATRGMRALGIRGLGVSMPYKQAVIPLLDELDPVAERIGAVNTIVNDDGRLRGYNTDWIGAVRALEEVTHLGGARVLLLGAGGAARAVAFGLAERGASVTVANRDLEKARQLAAAVGGAAVPLDAAALSPDHGVLVNATSLGMAEVDARSPVPEEVLREGLLVMDIVYKPMITELVAAARRRGATAVHGGRMLLHQAAEQFRLYTGREPPLDAMDEALRAQLG
ncbi:aroE1 [Sorangium cellulosum So ce56]|uniref:Shikimate dehydrogenase (NADP(+)) n=2 Tax=Sorangium cellulosum TaxID=56 RepID=A9FDV0_SORC5|nr:aroE1 [Sorangium cellulosum So ce56]